MKFVKHALRVTAIMAFGLAAPAAMASTTVHVSLWDKGADAMDNMDTANIMLGVQGDHSGATMGITEDVTSVPAGKVTFDVVNDSQEFVHEMIVAPVVSQNDPLPYDTGVMRVDEEAAGSLGEVSELDPGKTGALTLDLKPGEYILYCNIAGHYQMGMWTLLDVK